MAEPMPAGASRSVLLYNASAFLSSIALPMGTVAIAWDLYQRTSRAADLGYLGAAQFVPAAMLSLAAGHAADRYDRRRLLVGCYLILGAIACGLFVVPVRLGSWPIFVAMALLGATRSFAGPAAQALLPDLVPKAHLARVIAQSSVVWTLGFIAGPALGGLLFGVLGGKVYLVCGALCGLSALLTAAIRSPRSAPVERIPGWRSALGGVRFIVENKIILGAISLDLFAVLFGGAVAIMPIYAREVLNVGPWGLGLLRGAPSVGASLAGLALMRWPLTRRVGPVLLLSVALFGAATVVFGRSSDLAVSLAALVAIGAFDMVSVIVRKTLIQVETPVDMRGRVSAVESIFVGASNGLGDLEAGLTAAWLGLVPSVLVGGFGAILIVVIWSVGFPALRRLDHMSTGE